MAPYLDIGLTIKNGQGRVITLLVGVDALAMFTILGRWLDTTTALVGTEIRLTPRSIYWYLATLIRVKVWIESEKSV